jgi:hypothetical protein
MAIILAQTTCHSKPYSVLQKIIVVPRPLTERIKELRQEIAELTEKTLELRNLTLYSFVA